MARSRLCALVSAYLIALRGATGAVVTRQGEAAPCSLLLNSATAIRHQGELEGESAGLQALSGLLGATKPKSNVRFHPVVAVLGAPSLFQSGPQTDDTERINLSPAIELQDEVCFNAMQDKKHDTLEATCRTVCTRLQTGEASIAYHDTDFGNIPFLFIGEDAQKYAGCREIEYPDYRAALGWVCKGLSPVGTDDALQAETASGVCGATAVSALVAAAGASVALLM